MTTIIFLELETGSRCFSDYNDTFYDILHFSSPPTRKVQQSHACVSLRTGTILNTVTGPCSRKSITSFSWSSEQQTRREGRT